MKNEKLDNIDQEEPKLLEDIKLYTDFYENHTFTGSKDSANVLAERDDSVIKSLCYDH